MLTLDDTKTLYQALLDRNSDFEGVFFVGVKTTGVFCRPTCPARKPNFENCVFFQSAEQALIASFAPCKRCTPLSPPNPLSASLRDLKKAIDENPEKRWKDSDLAAFSLDPSSVRRQFKKAFGMTYIEYARAKRMGVAMKTIFKGESVIQAQHAAGYESGSGFRDAFSKIMGTPPAAAKQSNVLYSQWIETILGPMIAVADDQALYLLEFVDRRGLEREIERLRRREKASIVPGTCGPLDSIQQDLQNYFSGTDFTFKTPIKMIGSDFQKSVWQQLLTIPVGQTWSYRTLATHVGNPKAYRAVANANGCNQLALIIPCHRVINASGELGGYAGGLARKKWLIEHEKR